MCLNLFFLGRNIEPLPTSVNRLPHGRMNQLYSGIIPGLVRVSARGAGAAALVMLAGMG